MKPCRCGNPSKIKGLCKKCYFTDYYKEATKHKPMRRVGRPSKDYEKVFKLVLNKVKEGLNVSRACVAVDENREALYKSMSKEQIKELKQYAV